MDYKTTYHDDYLNPHGKSLSLREFTTPCSMYDHILCACGVTGGDNVPMIHMEPLEGRSYEWSRLGPMGALLEPRLYPTKEGRAEIETRRIMEPENYGSEILENRPYLFNIAPTSPLPSTDLLRRINDDRLHTTYQMDYGHADEHPWGNYENLMLAAGYIPSGSFKKPREEVPCRPPIRPPYLNGHEIPGRHNKDRDLFGQDNSHRRESKRNSKGLGGKNSAPQTTRPVRPPRPPRTPRPPQLPTGRLTDQRARVPLDRPGVYTDVDNTRNTQNLTNQWNNRPTRPPYTPRSPQLPTERLTDQRAKVPLERAGVYTDVDNNPRDTQNLTNQWNNERWHSQDSGPATYDTLNTYEGGKAVDLIPGNTDITKQSKVKERTAVNVTSGLNENVALILDNADEIPTDKGQYRRESKLNADEINEINTGKRENSVELKKPLVAAKTKQPRKVLLDGGETIQTFSSTPWTSEYQDIISGTADEIINSNLHYYGKLRLLPGNMPPECHERN